MPLVIIVLYTCVTFGDISMPWKAMIESSGTKVKEWECRIWNIWDRNFEALKLITFICNNRMSMINQTIRK